MTQNKTGIFWFTNDLRLHDQPALMRATTVVDELICVYVLSHDYLTSAIPSTTKISRQRLGFLHESLISLNDELTKLGQKLIVVKGSPERALGVLIEHTSANIVFRSTNAGWDENRVWSNLQSNHPSCSFSSVDSHTLFDQDQLPFSISELPTSFTQFRKVIEKRHYAKPIAPIRYLPPSPSISAEFNDFYFDLSKTQNLSQALFKGGESEGLIHLQAIFKSNQVANYKDVRNSLDGWQNSCKLSPWLANGCLSVREVASQLNHHEQTIIRNDSTYWLYFELLWREFFQLYAHKNGSNVFAFKGLKSQSPLTSFYPERFKKWVAGTTPFPIVNACMNELRETGYLSNRGRQIVASCLVNELSIDWRYGADYFEKILIDYDVASNWGNWQYLAGVGADTRDKRHFNLAKQTQQFDPDGSYIAKWADNNAIAVLDSVDAADWPIAG